MITRRSLLQLLGMAPAVAVVAKSLPTEPAPFEPRTPYRIETGFEPIDLNNIPSGPPIVGVVNGTDTPLHAGTLVVVTGMRDNRLTVAAAHGDLPLAGVLDGTIEPHALGNMVVYGATRVRVA